jgi:excinuclease UvrABC nuclease subunit
VDSSFEADLVYLQAARAVFPQSYRGMIGFRPAWFIHVDPDAPFPRYTKTIDLSKSGQRIGPVEDKHAAQRLIELVEDAFDLCRYYNILLDAPHGRACAYKQMHKCPAPCDGSIAMEQYRRLIEWSAQVLIDPRQVIQQQQRRMAAAAAELRFEAAAKIKAFIQQLSQFAAGPYRHARRLDDFAFLSLQRGPRAGTAKAFLVTPGRVSEMLGLVGAPRPSQVLERALAAAHQTPRQPIDEVAAEVIGVVAHHLFQPRTAQGVFLPLDQIDEPSIARAWSELLRQKAPPDGSDEGVLKELAAMRS